MMTAQLCNLVLTLVTGITVLAEAAPEYQTRPTCPYPDSDPACPQDCAVEYYRDSDNCLMCRCDPNDPWGPWEETWECTETSQCGGFPWACVDGYCSNKEELVCKFADFEEYVYKSQSEIDEMMGDCISCTCGGMGQEWDCQDVKEPRCQKELYCLMGDMMLSQAQIDAWQGECVSCTCGGMEQEWECQDVNRPGCEKPCIDSKGVSHPSGSSFDHEDGCNTCYCHDGNAGCTRIGCLPPKEELLCNIFGDTKSQSEIDEIVGDCKSCTCSGMHQEWECQDVKEPRCQKPCIDNGVSHPSGSTFDHHDGCNWCNCHNGNALCTLMACEIWPKGNNNNNL